MKLATAAVVVVIFLALAGAWLWTPDLDRTSLESRYGSPPSTFIDIDGVRLHVRDTGPRSAPVVVLIHGFGSSLHTWQAWAEKLDTRFRVVRFDLPGCGLSSPDPRDDYSDARSLALVVALLDRLNIARASIVGNSIGGRIAWKFASIHPQRVEKLVLVSPDGFSSPGFEYGKAPEVPAVLSAMRYVLPPAVLRMNLKPAYADPTALTDVVFARYYDLMRAPGVRTALLARMKQTVLQDPVPSLKSIEAPTLLIWGLRDAMIPAANAKEYLAAIRQSTLVSLDEIGHVPQEEAPERSLEPLMTFLSS